MAHQELNKYITTARSAGMTNEQIVTALTSAGWRVHDLVDLIVDHAPKVADSANIITVNGVTRRYDKFVALDNVSFNVRRGGVTALLGPNGAGKTTLVRIMTTLLKPTDGTVTVAGFDVVNDAQKLRSVIGLAGQYAAVDAILTGRENLEMVGRLYHLNASEAKKRAQELLEQLDLVDAADRTLKTYSGGMRRRLDLAASILIKPQILFLDEPTSGLDPRSRFALWNVIRDLVAGGTTVLLTTQYLEEADQLADQIFVIDKGHIIAQGTADELKRKVGGDVLELHVANHAEAERAATIVSRFGDQAAKADTGSGIITMPVSRGAAVLVDVIRELDAVGLKITNIVLRRPSLDDVFLKLTGHGAE